MISELTGRAIIDALAEHDIIAHWEYPGYVCVYLEGDSVALNLNDTGVEGEDMLSVDVLDDYNFIGAINSLIPIAEPNVARIVDFLYVSQQQAARMVFAAKVARYQWGEGVTQNAPALDALAGFIDEARGLIARNIQKQEKNS